MSDSLLDPSIQAMLDEAGVNGDSNQEESVPVSADSQAEVQRDPFEVDLNLKSFAPITQFFLDQPSKYYDDPQYYKSVLTGEGDAANRVHAVLTRYLTCKDPKDRTVYRQQMVNAYWELVHTIAPKMLNPDTPISKRLMLRFGVLLPSLFSAEQKELFSKVILPNKSGEPVLYMDEWFQEIASGRLNPSMTDESRPTKSTGGNDAAEQQRLMALQSKNSGRMQACESQVKVKEAERTSLESELQSYVNTLTEHTPMLELPGHMQAYSETQKKAISEINERLRRLLKCDKELSGNLRELAEIKQSYVSVEQKLAAGPSLVAANTGNLDTEFGTVRQMAKMTIGRQGNQFPVFTREFFHCIPKTTGFRENVLSILSWVESIDPGAFCRIHKNMSNRIVPFVLLVPTYGDFGFCWEPFDRYNRITSRGRIVIPMYPRDLTISILRAVADLRWQVAKEKASYYWMEEGLTGQYYQWIDSQKLKGDLKSFFVEDYILWMTKEANGVQRLDKTVRGIFWRFMPFPQALKDDLKKRSLVYAELCQKDMNRAMSDGY
ncbi:MAG: hypothetical protein K6E51_01560 [Treponema sp.]|nr:hypothetical protein [Treponema sp.]